MNSYIKPSAWMLFVLSVALIVVGMGRLFDEQPAQSNEQTADNQSVFHYEQQRANDDLRPLLVAVQIQNQPTPVRVPLEEYVAGVVAAEMPASFEMEALKAQAIAARTYIVHRMLNASQASPFVVSDTVTHQAYLHLPQVDPDHLRKVKQAAKDTAGTIVTYQDRPIDATYFSTSNGFTEDAQDYWGKAVPYLIPVASPWDPPISNRYRTTQTFSYREFAARLGIPPGSAKQTAKDMRIIRTTRGHRIREIRVGDHTFSGREFRQKLSLRSADFDWRMGPSHIEFTVFGYGHGVGMSQWGAQGMALQGYTAPAIIRHYYRGTELANVSELRLNQ